MRRANDLVAVATAAILLAGCATVGDGAKSMSPASLPAASPTVVPSTSSSPVASPSADPVPGGLEVGRIAEIVTTDLVVRSLPEISDASLIDPVRVPIGYLAYIVDGPVAADGHDWYLVAPFLLTFSDVAEPRPGFGWLAAAGKDGERWIAPWNGGCPEPNRDGIMLSPRYLALTCWGRAAITLEGTLSHCGDFGEPTGEPAWLFSVACFLGVPGYDLVSGLGISFAPELQSTPGNQASVRVTGHLDDPAAATCTEEPSAGTEPTHRELVRLHCRLSFVVTEITGL